MKHIVCFSGGHSSAIVAIEVVRKFGKENCILLNHDISTFTEHEDIKRFKREVSEYLGIDVTYANHTQAGRIPDQFDVIAYLNKIKGGNGDVLCTSKLKTEPFNKYLMSNHPGRKAIIYYGFDKSEVHRIQRRSSYLAANGFKTDYPLALWKERTIHSTEEVGIAKPLVYTKFKHANCIGCLKGGKLHWYVTYLERPDIFEKAKGVEEGLFESIVRGTTLAELEVEFAKLKEAGVDANEHEDGRTFAARARKVIRQMRVDDLDSKPCECTGE